MRDIPIGGQDSVLNLHEAKALKLNSLCDDSTIVLVTGIRFCLEFLLDGRVAT